MASRGASLLRSIGTVLHIPPSSHFPPDRKHSTPNREVPIKKFEEALETRLTALIPQDESQAFTVEWLTDAIHLALATNLDAQMFIPEVQSPLSPADKKWISEYLDYSLIILSMCNKIRQGIRQIDKVILLVKSILHFVTSQPSLDHKRFSHLKDAIIECSMTLKNMTEIPHDDLKRTGKNGRYLIKDVPKPHLRAKSEQVMRKQAFLEALYAAKVTTSVMCSLVVEALNPAGDYPAEQPVMESFVWSIPFMSLQKTVKAVVRKRMDQGLSFPILEICDLDFYLSKLKVLLDQHGSDDFDILEQELKGEASAPIRNLKYHSEVLEKALKLLESEVDGLFCMTMSNRKSLLDKLQT